MRIAILFLLLFLPVALRADNGHYDYVWMKDMPLKPDLSRLPRFFTSDPAYDEFLNDYFMRHLTVDERGIYQGQGFSLGTTDHMWVIENDRWFFPWIDRAAMGQERQGNNNLDVILNTMRMAAVDKYGYVWGARPEPEPRNSLGGYRPTFGWPWPKYNRDTTVSRPTGWEFNDVNDGWRKEWTARDVDLEPGYVNDTLSGKITGPNPEILSPTFDVDVFQVPIVEIDIAYSANATKLVNQMKVYWTTDKEQDFSEDRCVTPEFCDLPPSQNSADYEPWAIPPNGRYGLYFPMLLHPKWGSAGRRIARLKIVPTGPGAEGVTVSLNYVRASYDIRMTTTNTTLIDGVYRFYMWNGNKDYLTLMMPRLRRALLFLNEHLKGRREGLICQDWFAGHDGLGGDKPGHGQIGGYWDLLPAGRFDLDSSVAYYSALNAMAELEKTVRRLHVAVPDVSVIGPDNKTVLHYAETPATLRALAKRVKQQIEKRFWVKETGRFCRNIDAHGVRIDYGFLHSNLLALASGIGTPAQRDSVLSWLDGREIPGDTSTGADIYRFRFGPRTTTRRNKDFYFWPWIWERTRDSANPIFAFGNQVQDGGAVPFTSFFELLTRCRTSRQDQIDRAYARTREIQSWYNDVKAAGGKGRDFYRAYYVGHPERGMMQSPTPGGIGLDHEFLSDSALGTVFLPLAFMGLQSKEDAILDIAPAVPSGLKRIGVANVAYRGCHLEIEAGSDYLSLKGSDIPPNNGLKVRVALRKVPSTSAILVDGKPAKGVKRDSNRTTTLILPLRPFLVKVRGQ